jgi:hypothetical protein
MCNQMLSEWFPSLLRLVRLALTFTGEWKAGAEARRRDRRDVRMINFLYVRPIDAVSTGGP